jgi:hypothetical protein
VKTNSTTATSRQPIASARQIVDRAFDEGRGPEDRRIDLHIAQARLEFADRGFHVMGKLEGVAGRLLLDDQHQSGAVVDDRVADRRGEAVDHAGDVADADRRFAALLDDRLCKIGRGLDRARLLHGEPLGCRIDEAAPADQHRITGRGAQFGERHASSAQSVGIDQNLQLAVAETPDRDVGDARHRHQARPDRPTRQFGELHLIELGRRYADLHRPTGRRQWRQHHRRTRGGGQPCLHLCHPLLYELAGADYIGAAIEQDRYRRQTEHGLGPQRHQIGDAVDRRFDRHGNQAFHLFGRKTRRFGLNLDHRRCELGKYIERHVAGRA